MLKTLDKWQVVDLDQMAYTEIFFFIFLSNSNVNSINGTGYTALILTFGRGASRVSTRYVFMEKQEKHLSDTVSYLRQC